MFALIKTLPVVTVSPAALYGMGVVVLLVVGVLAGAKWADKGK